MTHAAQANGVLSLQLSTLSHLDADISGIIKDLGLLFS
jgi:hypothetical protein